MKYNDSFLSEIILKKSAEIPDFKIITTTFELNSRSSDDVKSTGLLTNAN